MLSRLRLLVLLAGCIAVGGGASSGTIVASHEPEGLIPDLNKLIIKQLDQHRMQVETQKLQVPVLPREVEEEDVLEPEEPDSKITYMLREELRLNQDKGSTFNVRVRVHFNYTGEDFEKAFKEMFGHSLEFTQRKFNSYLIENMSCEQVIQLEKLDEVLIIGSMHDYTVPDQVAEQLQMDPSMMNKKTVKESLNVKTNTIQLQPIQPRGLGPNDQPLELKVESKIMFDVPEEEEKSKKNGMSGLIPVQISLDFDIEDAETKFEKEIDATFGDSLKYKRVGYRTYDAWVTKVQLDDLESVSTIKFLFKQPEKEDEIYTTDYQSPK